MTTGFSKLLGLVLVCSGSVYGSSFTMIPAADAFVTTGPSGNLADKNYGGAGSFAVAAPGLANGEFQSVAQFNLGPAVSAFDTEFGVGGWHIQSVSLQLTATTAGNPIFNAPAAGSFGISWMQNDSWVEGTGTPSAAGTTGITFNTLQSTFMSLGDESLGTFAFGGGTSGSSVYTLSVPAGFEADIDAGGLVSVRFSAADSAVSGIFNSRSFGTVAARPVLTVQAVPEPSVVGMGGLGLAVIAWSVRRAKRA